ncbi:hypothetical protein AVEN_15601-1 [Araneus ventricosus]|uniref:Uncharacterized protein n=1 Tax=Araneus ventricosus TaxID=182803 RepID=A0A4Y2VM56_ARAVE|nr:hypothetical protein AVEN_15601-1 [Araneus ventricosus]
MTMKTDIYNNLLLQNRPIGVWRKQYKKQDNGERHLNHEYTGKHESQVAGKTALARIRKINRNFHYRTASITIPALTADTTLKTISVDQLVQSAKAHSQDVQICDPSTALFIVSRTGRDRISKSVE